MIFILLTEIIANVIRLDLAGSPLQKNYITTSFPAVAKSGFKQKLSTESAFNIQMDCHSSITPELCENARKALESASNRVAHDLRISETINIKFTFRPFCPLGNKTCSVSNVLGQASAAASFIVNFNGTYVSYPQALMKNLEIDQQLEYNPIDIVGDFNSDFDFWFPSQGNAPGPKQYDFELVAAHEITHGLGISSNLVYFYDVSNKQTKPGYLVPYLYSTEKLITSDTLFSAFQPISIYDYYISSSLGPFSAFGSIIQRFRPKSASQTTFIQQFEKSSYFNAGRNMFNAATYSIFFQTSNGNISLFTPKPFSGGSSISHTSTDFANSPDFLMTPKLVPNTTIDNLIAKYNGTGLYGPQLLSILSQIGWATSSNQGNLQSVSLATDFDSNFGTTTDLGTNDIPNIAVSWSFACIYLVWLIN